MKGVSGPLLQTSPVKERWVTGGTGPSARVPGAMSALKNNRRFRPSLSANASTRGWKSGSRIAPASAYSRSSLNMPRKVFTRPPTRFAFASRTTTSWPARFSRVAAVSPATPAPTTSTRFRPVVGGS
ncbi:hypothetical protein GCM10020229_72990 [Kitasatospora albolonga]